MSNMYDLERLFELDQQERQVRIERELGHAVGKTRARMSVARLGLVTYLLALLGVG